MKRTRAKDAHALEGTRPFTLTWVDDIFIFDDEPFLEVEVVVGKRGSEDSDDDDLESFFMDYRLRRQRQRLWEAAAEVEAQMALLSDDDGGNESEGEANETTNEKSGLIPGK